MKLRPRLVPTIAAGVGLAVFLSLGVWQLRRNTTAYDAVYLALAEALDAPLLTRDQRMASAPGHRAKVDVL